MLNPEIMRQYGPANIGPEIPNPDDGDDGPVSPGESGGPGE